MTKVLTSDFPHGFTDQFMDKLKGYIKPKSDFCFVASEFDLMHETNDWYCHHYQKMFSDKGLTFNSFSMVDSRLSKEEMHHALLNCDIIWLAGGDTPTQFKYLVSYGLVPIIQNHTGLTIGMSAGSINMTKTALCSITCDHAEQKIYEAMGLVDFSVEPHFDHTNLSEELLKLSCDYPFIGLPDNSAIFIDGTEKSFVGDVFHMKDGLCERLGA